MSLLEEGIKFHQKGLIDKAQVIYENILVKDPINFAALEFLGIIFFQKKEYEKGFFKTTTSETSVKKIFFT